MTPNLGFLAVGLPVAEAFHKETRTFLDPLLRRMSVLGRYCWKKSFLAAERNFSGLLMRIARRYMRDHNVFHKNDHGPSYRP
jgi:hypothetical protein